MKHTHAAVWMALAVGLAFFAVAADGRAGVNLVANGNFDKTDDNLQGWRYKFDATGENWYTNNHSLVSVVESDNGRRKVLKLHGTFAELQVPGQGVRVDSHPIAVDLSSGKYRFSLYARSSGPACRILVEGFRWAPGVTPHAKPDNTELRKCYRFSQLYFGRQQAGEWAVPGAVWQHGASVFPDDKLSEQARKNLAQIKFLVIHIVAIGGSDGDLLVDDAKIEKIR